MQAKLMGGAGVSMVYPLATGLVAGSKTFLSDPNRLVGKGGRCAAAG
jgi:hypothetical protein